MSSTVPLILQEDCEQGGKDYDDGIENDFAYRNNVLQASKNVRMAFIRKVYGLLATQLFLTVIVASVCLFVEPVKNFIRTNDWLMLIALFGSFGILIALFIKRKETPINLILLAAFTVFEAYTVGVIVSVYSQTLVLEALLLTFAVLAGLTLYTFQTKHDFSSMHSVLIAGLCILIVGGFIQIFVQSSMIELLMSLGGAFLFSLFIVFDTQMMLEKLSPEEYILATINLYMDILNLFIYILRILQAANRQ
ncbi:PREDICTED: protein lifeguard 4-like [Nicrophorus vespilloides]|uniref:Protein lifeguard 4-like n=1 Tax=Nicrophorus vespilloides TaxID=110193 RepID=A0ABM1N8U0_NICVS|nr:PREDICTED: protein lifeguard 4-like [Nicrophorus vespilloides]